MIPATAMTDSSSESNPNAPGAAGKGKGTAKKK
jgi:hypothetical protein